MISKISLLFMMVTSLTTACGITKSKYVPYKETAATGDCEAAKTAFTENVAPYVPTNCSCHTTGQGGSLVFATGDDDGNRKTLKKQKGGTAKGIYEYITSSSHGGSSSVGKLTQENLNTWLTAEASCQ